MRPKSKERRETVPAVRLFRNELDHILSLFKEHSLGVKISDNDYDYKDLYEVRERVGRRIRELKISGEFPESTLHFSPSFGIDLMTIQSPDENAEQQRNAEILFVRVKEYLSQHRTLQARVTRPQALVTWFAFFVAVSFLVPRADFWAALDRLRRTVLLVIAIIGSFSLGALRPRSFLYYGYPNEKVSFWKRKKDDLILLLVGAVGGGIIAELIHSVVAHLSK